jgi:hypothetical protein
MSKRSVFNNYGRFSKSARKTRGKASMNECDFRDGDILVPVSRWNDWQEELKTKRVFIDNLDIDRVFLTGMKSIYSCLDGLIIDGLKFGNNGYITPQISQYLRLIGRAWDGLTREWDTLIIGGTYDAKSYQVQVMRFLGAIHDLGVCFRGFNMEQRGTKSAPFNLNSEFIDDGVEICTIKFEELEYVANDLPSFEDLKSLSSLTLATDFLAGTGLGCFQRTQPLVLYLRSSFLAQVEFIRATVLEQKRTGFIHGQPGSGKSVCALYVCGRLAQEGWNVTWIHMVRVGEHLINDGLIVKFRNGCKFGSRACIRDISKSFDFVVDDRKGFAGSTRRHLLVIDGIMDKPGYEEISSKWLSWLHETHGRHRLLFVSSVGSAGAVPADAMMSLGREHVVGFRTFSWTLNEYKDGMRIEEFAESVDDYLDAISTDSSLDERIEAKFFIAGGCARFMFERTSKTVQGIYDELLFLDRNVKHLVNMGSGSTDLTHRLISLYPDERRQIVSKCAELKIAIMLGPDNVKALASNLTVNGNPSALGVYLEAYFFSLVGTGLIPLYKRNREAINWACNKSFRIFEHKNPLASTCPLEMWLRPVAWNCPTYDAVYLRVEQGKRVVRFVQITRAVEHDLKLRYCAELICALQNNDVFIAEVVEIFFVVPDRILDSFKISNITNPFALSNYGWPETAELVRNRIQILGIDFNP